MIRPINCFMNLNDEMKESENPETIYVWGKFPKMTEDATEWYVLYQEAVQVGGIGKIMGNPTIVKLDDLNRYYHKS